MSETPKAPFTSLGKHLRYVREQSHESILEVSGAVEIDEKQLQMIEAGEVRPSEDILLLLISHFGVADHDAVRLWELAKYDSDLPDQFKPDIEQLSGNKVVMLMAMDMRVMYSDGLNIQTSGGGLTLNFTQASSQGAPMPIARVGMSSEQAEQVLVELGKAILRLRYSGGKHQLPPRT